MTRRSPQRRSPLPARTCTGRSRVSSASSKRNGLPGPRRAIQSSRMEALTEPSELVTSVSVVCAIGLRASYAGAKNATAPAPHIHSCDGEPPAHAPACSFTHFRCFDSSCIPVLHRRRSSRERPQCAAAVVEGLNTQRDMLARRSRVLSRRRLEAGTQARRDARRRCARRPCRSRHRSTRAHPGPRGGRCRWGRPRWGRCRDAPPGERA